MKWKKESVADGIASFFFDDSVAGRITSFPRGDTFVVVAMTL